MKWLIGLFLLLFSLLILPSAIVQPPYLEDTMFALAFGIDLNEENELVFYESSPIFNKEVKEKKELHEVRAKTIRQSRKEFDRRGTGTNVGSKVQVLLIGKRLLQDPNWFSLLDNSYRDTKATVNPRIIIVDGPVSGIMHFNPKNKPITSIYLRSLIDSSHGRGESIQTTLQDLHRQMFDKGLTPCIPKIKLGKEVIVTGSTLLNEKGTLSASLDSQETTLLQILQGDKADYIFTLPIIKGKEENTIYRNMLSFNAHSVKTKIHTGYRHGKFTFDIHINMYMELTERPSPFDMINNNDKLEQMVEEQLKMQFGQFIKKIQKHKIDPIGLGVYARAYQNKHYEQVRDHWGKALGEATINTSVDVTTRSMGAVK
ncbi:Ger(x)C family spore germination protein [Neobacillus ginsengisoli]|uniref:Ger(X)C family germination protein n=1 Tax=Neobacillus ginsengisoli TaxID=904295 RepID=A0ABT9Y1J0_9BACI|nr:Ger(x)C family spore germination protein [Neobacillus ginsengisoli]MDQ0201508.1 Ger(x)C family germination protein [Neobacillus ginsengisoli]